MSKFSDYTETNILETTLRGMAYPVPSGTYIALFTADPTDANATAGEITALQQPNYARVDAALGAAISTGWTASNDGVSSNAKILTFPANNGPAAIQVTHMAIYDAQTGGNMLYHAPLVTPKTVEVGDVISFSIGTIVVTVA